MQVCSVHSEKCLHALYAGQDPRGYTQDINLTNAKRNPNP